MLLLEYEQVGIFFTYDMHNQYISIRFYGAFNALAWRVVNMSKYPQQTYIKRQLIPPTD
jgi:hypothetical protein